jgi:hypothetical protein
MEHYVKIKNVEKTLNEHWAVIEFYRTETESKSTIIAYFYEEKYADEYVEFLTNKNK